jgi:hypothetical protein
MRCRWPFAALILRSVHCTSATDFAVEDQEESMSQFTSYSRRSIASTVTAVLAVAALGAASPNPAQAGLWEGDHTRWDETVLVSRSAYAYSTPYVDAASKHTVTPGRYVATCQAKSSSAEIGGNQWWSRMREGTWVNNGNLAKLPVLPTCTAPPDDHGTAPPVSTAAGLITRREVLARSLWWIQKHVMYSQNASTDGYRRDCSGYVSLVWHLRGSPSSTVLRSSAYTSAIAKSVLQPGDALGRPGHIALFVGWASGGRPIVREEYDDGHPAEQRTWSTSYAATFTAYRYKNIR